MFGLQQTVFPAEQVAALRKWFSGLSWLTVPTIFPALNFAQGATTAMGRLLLYPPFLAASAVSLAAVAVFHKYGGRPNVAARAACTRVSARYCVSPASFSTLTTIGFPPLGGLLTGYAHSIPAWPVSPVPVMHSFCCGHCLSLPSIALRYVQRQSYVIWNETRGRERSAQATMKDTWTYRSTSSGRQRQSEEYARSWSAYNERSSASSNGSSSGGSSSSSSSSSSSKGRQPPPVDLGNYYALLGLEGKVGAAVR